MRFHSPFTSQSSSSCFVVLIDRLHDHNKSIHLAELRLQETLRSVSQGISCSTPSIKRCLARLSNQFFGIFTAGLLFVQFVEFEFEFDFATDFNYLLIDFCHLSLTFLNSSRTLLSLPPNPLLACPSHSLLPSSLNYANFMATKRSSSGWKADNWISWSRIQCLPASVTQYQLLPPNLPQIPFEIRSRARRLCVVWWWDWQKTAISCCLVSLKGYSLGTLSPHPPIKSGSSMLQISSEPTMGFDIISEAPSMRAQWALYADHRA